LAGNFFIEKKELADFGELEEYAKGSNTRNPAQPARQDQKFSRRIRKEIEKINEKNRLAIEVKKERREY